MSSTHGRLRVETVRKTVEGKVYTSVLLRRSFRKDGKVQHETLGNLTRLPPDVIESIKRRLSGELDADAPQASFEIIRSLPHGHLTAVLQTAQQLGLESLLASRSCRERDLIMALIVARVLSPRSKLSTAAADSSPGIYAGDLAARSSKAPKAATQPNIWKWCRRLRGLILSISQFPGLKPRAIIYHPSGTKNAQLQSLRVGSPQLADASHPRGGQGGDKLLANQFQQLIGR